MQMPGQRNSLNWRGVTAQEIADGSGKEATSTHPAGRDRERLECRETSWWARSEESTYNISKQGSVRSGACLCRGWQSLIRAFDEELRAWRLRRAARRLAPETLSMQP